MTTESFQAACLEWLGRITQALERIAQDSPALKTSRDMHSAETAWADVRDQRRAFVDAQKPRIDDAQEIPAAAILKMREDLAAEAANLPQAIREDVAEVQAFTAAGLTRADAMELSSLQDDAQHPPLTKAIKSLCVSRLGEAGFARARDAVGGKAGEYPSAAKLRRLVLEHLAGAK
jgi:hypothetical protein